MKYMLDTNICIFLIHDDVNVKTAFKQNKKDGIAISVITLAELEFGINNCKSKKSKEINRNKLISFLSMVEILDFNTEAAAEYGKIHAELCRCGQVIGIMDTLISAHAKSLGLTLVTNNTREFQRVDGLALEDWL
jgi:tRNA(fMet)-specific endonuclease VapC